MFMVKRTEPGMITQVAYVPREWVKSDVVLRGLEFLGESKGSHTVYTLVGEE